MAEEGSNTQKTESWGWRRTYLNFTELQTKKNNNKIKQTEQVQPPACSNGGLVDWVGADLLLVFFTTLSVKNINI